MALIIFIVAILFYVSIFLIFRLFEYYKINNFIAIIANYFTAALLSFTLYSGPELLIEIPTQTWFTPALILGFLFMISFLLFAISIQKAGIAITSVASKMSVIIPVFLGAYLYDNEYLNYLKIIGLIAALASFYLIFKKKNSEHVELSKMLLPLLIFLASGLGDSLLKYIREIYFQSLETNLNTEILFMGSLFSISFIFSLLVFGTRSVIKKDKLSKKDVLAGMILGIFNFLSALTMFKAMSFYESAVFFPIFNVSVVSLSALMGIVLFKEKMTKVNIIGIGLAIITILTLALN